MKKTFVTILTIILSMMILTACTIKKENGTLPTQTQTVSAPTETAVPTPVPTAEPWEINSFTEGVPVVTFGKKVMDDAGEFFLAMYDDVQLEDIKAYAQELVQSGFTQTGFKDDEFVKYTFENSSGKRIEIDYAGAMTVSIYK